MSINPYTGVRFVSLVCCVHFTIYETHNNYNMANYSVYIKLNYICTNSLLLNLCLESIYNNILPTLSILDKEKKDKLILELNSLNFKI